jgi:hypothetical protein
LRFKFSAAVAFVLDIYFKCLGSFEGLGNELPCFNLLCHFDTCSELHCEVITMPCTWPHKCMLCFVHVPYMLLGHCDCLLLLVSVVFAR